LALAGVAGPIVFAAIVLTQTALRPDHSLIADPISALEIGQYGWVQNVNFIVLGTLMIVFAVALRLGVAGAVARETGFTLLVVSGVGLLLQGLFPAHPGGAPQERESGLPTFPITFGSAGIGLIVMSRAMTRDGSWTRLARVALVSGSATLMLLIT